MSAAPTHAPAAPAAHGVSRRVVLAGVVLVAVVCALALAVIYRDTHGPGRLDALVDPALAVDGSLRRVLRPVVMLGDPVLVAVLAGLVAVGCWWAGRRRAAVVAVVGPALAAAVTEFVLKPGVGRTLGGTEAYPSGHTVTVVALAAVVLVVARDARRPRSRSGRVLLTALAVAVPATVGVSLVALGLHYTTDVVGGACVSLAAVLGVALTLGVAGGPRS